MIPFLLRFADTRCGSGTEGTDGSVPHRGETDARSARLRERLRDDRLFSLLDGRPYLLHRPVTLESHDGVSRRDSTAKRDITNRGVTAHELPGVGIDLRRAATEHQHAIVLNDRPCAVDDEDALRGTRRRTDS